MAAQIDLFRILFEQILKIDPSLLWKYATVSDQLLYLILIPHAVLILFLWGFGRAVAPGHSGLQKLLAIVAYLFIIWGGWYGTFLVPIIAAWFPMLLVIAFIFFFGSRIIHPARAREMFELGKGITSKVMEKPKMRKEIENRLKEIQSELRAIGTNTDPYAYVLRRELQAEKGRLEAKLREL